MVRTIVATALACAAILLLAWSAPVQADEEHMRLHHADAQHDEWMRSLKRPDTGGSCCNLRDCNPTDAEWRDGQWWAVLRGQWIAIPPEKVLTHPRSLDGEAWLCASLSSTFVFCFVPPLNNY
jgi:hypothetical protein